MKGTDVKNAYLIGNDHPGSKIGNPYPVSCFMNPVLAI